MTTQDEVEEVARALNELERSNIGTFSWEALDEMEREGFREEAQVAIATIDRLRRAAPAEEEICLAESMANPQSDHAWDRGYRAGAASCWSKIRALTAMEPKASEPVPSPAAEGWRPIATAPRDGTPVALYAPTRREPFQCGFWIWKSDDNDDPLHGVWWLGDGRYEDQPVAWMPLPTPPKEETHG